MNNGNDQKYKNENVRLIEILGIRLGRNRRG